MGVDMEEPGVSVVLKPKQKSMPKDEKRPAEPAHPPPQKKAEGFDSAGLLESFEKTARWKFYNQRGTCDSWSACMGWKILSSGGDIMWVHPDEAPETLNPKPPRTLVEP